MIDAVIFLVIAVSLVLIVAGAVWAVQDAGRHRLRVSGLASREGWTYSDADRELSRTVPGPYRTLGDVRMANPRYDTVAIGRYRDHEIAVAEHSFGAPGDDNLETWNVVAVTDLPASVPTTVVSGRRLRSGEARFLPRMLAAFTTIDLAGHELGADVGAVSKDADHARLILEHLDAEPIRGSGDEWQFHERTLGRWAPGSLDPDMVIKRLDQLIDVVARVPAEAWANLAELAPPPVDPSSPMSQS
jgi:hypothetical protein